MSRPVLLPALWASLRRAYQTGDPAEAVRLGQVLGALVPEWTDGLVHFAWLLAFDVGRRQRGPEQSVDILETALAWLDARRSEVEVNSPAEAAALLMAMALIVEERSEEDREVAAALRRRFGRDATALADDWVGQAIALAPSDAKRDAQAFLSLRVVAGALRMGDLEGALAALATSRRRLEALSDQDTVRSALGAISKLNAYLADPSAGTLEALEENDYLGEIAGALRAFPGGTFR